MFAFENTAMENYKGHFGEIQDFFQQHGYDEGGNWEYDHGFFDKKLADSPGYLFIRVPVFVQAGQFGEAEAEVKVGKPFLLRHKYQVGNDDAVDVSVGNASMNQFSEPEDEDASLKEEEVQGARQLIHQLDEAFRRQFMSGEK